MTLLLAALLPALAGLAGLAPALRARALDLLLGATGAGLLLALAAGDEGVTGGGWVVVDATTRLFFILSAVVALGIVLHARQRGAAAPALVPGLPRFAALFGLFLGAVQASLLSNHLVGTWLFIEASTLAGCPLIHHQGGPGALRAAWRYLLFSTVGLTLTFLGFVFLAEAMELHGGPAQVTFLVSELHGRPGLGDDTWRHLGLLLIVFGYGTKLGLAPMHAWVVETYDLAPPAVTATLSALQSTAVFTALVRVLQVYRASDAALVSDELIAMGLLTMVVSTLRLVTATSYKRLISNAAMMHNGIVAVGLGVGRGAAWGVVLYVASNALVKALLFLTCGQLEARYRTKRIADLSGLCREVPVTGALFMLGTFALLGFAPFGSFLGEVLILSGLMEGQHYAVFLAFCALLTVVLVATGRSLFPMIWGQRPRAAHAGGAAATESGAHGRGQSGRRAAAVGGHAAAVSDRLPARGGEALATLLPCLPYVVLLLGIGIYVPPPVRTLIEAVAMALAGGKA